MKKSQESQDILWRSLQDNLQNENILWSKDSLQNQDILWSQDSLRNQDGRRN